MSLDIDLYFDVPGLEEKHYVWDGNITHNCGRVAWAAGIYEAMWRPEELGLELAGDLAPLLSAGLWAMETWPAHFQQFEPSNGWGTLEQFIPFVREYLEACRRYPSAKVSTWR